DEFNKPVFQHSLTLLVAAAIIHWLPTTTPKRRHVLGFLRGSALLCLVVMISSGRGYNQAAAALRHQHWRPIMSPQAGWLLSLVHPAVIAIYTACAPPPYM